VKYDAEQFLNTRCDHLAERAANSIALAIRALEYASFRMSIAEADKEPLVTDALRQALSSALDDVYRWEAAHSAARGARLAREFPTSAEEVPE